MLSISPLKLLFVLKIFKFLPWVSDHVEKWLDLKDKVDFKIYDIITWDTNNCNTEILLNISRREGKQTMKFGQLIEYDTINIFLGKPCTKCGGEIIPRAFSKKSKLSLSPDQ